jgi:hypothetical protein
MRLDCGVDVRVRASPFMQTSPRRRAPLACEHHPTREATSTKQASSFFNWRVATQASLNLLRGSDADGQKGGDASFPFKYVLATG